MIEWLRKRSCSGCSLPSRSGGLRWRIRWLDCWRWALFFCAVVWWIVSNAGGVGGGLPRYGICLLLVGFCLVLTKSRTAWLASLCGLFMWLCLAYGRRVLSRTMLGRLLAAAGLIGALTMVGILSGALDRFVISEAFKSLRYRLEYWRGTWGVIAEQPWLGVGPGNFRQHYLKYKLPESSEEILDPHNLFLDAWANGGVIGLLGLLAVVAFFVIMLRRTPVEDAAPVGIRRDRSRQNPVMRLRCGGD